MSIKHFPNSLPCCSLSVAEKRQLVQLKLLMRGLLMTVCLPASPALSYPTVDLPPPDAPELQITVETLCQFTIQMSFLKTVIKISTAMIQTKGSTTPIHKCHQHSRHIPRDPPAKKEYRIFTARFLG
jgi:hypothetical protein